MAQYPTRAAAHTIRRKDASAHQLSAPAEDRTARSPTLPAPPRLAELPDGDEELFRLYAETDSDRALREIVNRYQPKIMRYFLRNSATSSRAEDLTQEVFIRIIRNRASFDPRQRFSTWSKTIAERIAINAARGAQRSRVITFSDMDAHDDAEEDWELDPPDPGPLSDEVVEQRETSEILADALALVEPRLRAPLQLHYLQGLTHTEAARRLGIPVGTAKSRTHRALADLRALLADRGLAPA